MYVPWNEFFGNTDWVFLDIKNFITCRRFETLSLHDVLQGFSSSDCDWLIPPGPGARQQHRVCVSDAVKRKELLEEFLFWFFDSFLLPLIKVLKWFHAWVAFSANVVLDLLLCDRVLCFSESAPLFQTRRLGYIMCTPHCKAEVSYFRKAARGNISVPIQILLNVLTFLQIDALAILRQRDLGFSFVRLLPKETGVRPIVNLRRKSKVITIRSLPDNSLLDSDLVQDF